MSTQTAMIEYLRELTSEDHFQIAGSVGIVPDNKADAHLIADYIVQGVSKGLSGTALTQYALANVARLQAIMPHLKEKSVPVENITTKEVPVATLIPKKVMALAKIRKSDKVHYEDFTIVFRADRNGYEGWHSGKAEAFRETVEKVEAFFTKKYKKVGPFKLIK